MDTMNKMTVFDTNKIDNEIKTILEDKIMESNHKNKKIVIYIHICCINNYEDIFMNFVDLIKKSKLYDVVYEIRCGVLGFQSQKFKNFIKEHSKIKIVIEDDNIKLYESFTINKIIEDSILEDNNILYLHTKGCTKPHDINVKSWVDYLCYFNITKWKIALDYLDANDMVGVNLQDRYGEELHYSGNFWWTKSSYVKYMKKIIHKQYNDPEFHMTKDGLGKFISLRHSYCSHYNKQYPKELYEGKEIIPYELTASKKQLNNIAIKYNLDKCLVHNYIPAYEKLFKNIRHKIKNLLEIGIGSIENNQMKHVSNKGYKTGNSLKCWEEYFPNAYIYGIDIFSHPELNVERIKTFVANQSSEKDLKEVIDKIDTSLDIIIDDGSHRLDHQVISFMYLHKYLSQNGIYIIEDIQEPHIEGFKNLSVFPEYFKEYINKNFVVEYFDTRHSREQYKSDDFMICFTKKKCTQNKVTITHNAGLFSCCSVRLTHILNYVNLNKKFPDLVDSSEQFDWYKKDSKKDITFEYFQHYSNIYAEIHTPIKYHWDHQFTNYSNIDHIGLKSLIKKYFSPSFEVDTIINNIQDKYKLDYENICVLFYRGNDKNRETTKCSYDDYLIYANQIIQKNPNIQFLIQSDETEFIEFMTKTFPTNSFYFKDEIRHIKKCDDTVDILMKSTNLEFSKKYLAITIIMSKCKYVICGSGNCDIWILFYRGNSINIAQNLQGKWYTSIE